MKSVQSLLLVMVVLSWSMPGHALQVPGPLIESKWLAAHQKDVVILDVRSDTRSFQVGPSYKVDRKTGKRRLVAVGGHIAGAALVNYKEVRATRTIDGQKVTRVVPEREAFEKMMQMSGVNQDSAIVIVSKGESNSDMTMATRLYWTLKYFGHDNMGILNGGVAQWLADGNKVDTGPGRPRPGDWRAGEGRREILATSADVAEAMKAGSAQLVDNRSISLYLGTWKMPYVHAKGHIPGARVFPSELMNTAGRPARFLTADELRQLNQAMNIDTETETITYCNSGHLASGGWFIMSELLGNKNTRVYDGSMHEWTLRKEPVNAMQME